MSEVAVEEERRVLMPTQREFVVCRDPFPAFVGGYGSGKSAAGIARAMALKTHFPKQNVCYYLPTYPLVEDIAFERFPELCERKGWAYKLRKGGAPHIEFPEKGRVLFRTMEKPERIVGYEVGHSILDEIDTLPIDKAEAVWNKVIARNRSNLPGGFPNTVGVVTTPEGFRFVWKRWVKNRQKGYTLFKAKTLDNAAHLPRDYVENLTNTYAGTPLGRAYLEGEFVNLTSGSVYPAYDRLLNHSSERVKPGDTLHIGMDFNVTKMAAVIHVLRDGKPHAVAEFVNVFDTPAMIRLIVERFPGHPVMVYPDASGGGRRSVNAAQSDIALLKAANWVVCANASNPLVRDRVLAMNQIINSREYRINPDTCPHYVEGLEKQAYDKNGEPDKTSDLDHVLDGGGYFISYRFPIVRWTTTVTPLRA